MVQTLKEKTDLFLLFLFNGIEREKKSNIKDAFYMLFYCKLFCYFNIINVFTIISVGLQRDVPQYMAQPWLMT